MAEVVCVALATAKGFGSVAVRRDLRAACTEEAAAELISDIVQLARRTEQYTPQQPLRFKGIACMNVSTL